MYDQLSQDSTFKFFQELQNIMGKNTADNGMVPGGYGEFGYDVTNPVPVFGVFGARSYLGRLRTMEDNRIEFERIGSTRAENLNDPVDMYKISKDGEVICTLYLCPYFKEVSDKAPREFTLLQRQ